MKKGEMHNNSTNINKINKFFSPQSTDHKQYTTRYDVGNPGHGCRQAKKCGGCKLIKKIILSNFR